MGLDDFDPREDEPGVEANLDDDLFDFPVPDRQERRPTEDEELADALEAVEEIAASMAPELDGIQDPVAQVPDMADDVLADDASPTPAPAAPIPPTTEPAAATDFDEDEDLFDFAPITSRPPAVSSDLEEDLDEVFADIGSEELDVDAIDELLDLEDAAQAAAEASEVAAPEPATPEPTPAPAAGTAPPTPSRTTPAAAAAPNADANAAPDAREGVPFTLPSWKAQRAVAAVSRFGGRLKGTPILWLVGLMVSTNLLMLVLFWSSLGSVRDLVVETIQKVASAPPAGTASVQRAPLRDTLQRNVPVVRAAEPNEAALMAEDTLATGQDLITQGRFEEARRDLFTLLASIDTVPSRDRDRIEAEANHLIGESYRAQADARADVEAATDAPDPSAGEER